MRGGSGSRWNAVFPQFEAFSSPVRLAACGVGALGICRLSGNDEGKEKYRALWRGQRER